MDSGQKAVPGSLQAAGLDQPGRRVQPTADPRLGIEKSLEPLDLQWPIGEPSAGHALTLEANSGAPKGQRDTLLGEVPESEGPSRGAAPALTEALLGAGFPD